MGHSAVVTVSLAVVLSACGGAPAAQRRAAATTTAARGSHATSLYDAFGRDGATEKDWGFSALVEHEGKTILFDSGRNADIFSKNVKALGVDLSKVDFAVLSHAHIDHSQGLDYALQVNPKMTVYVPDDGSLGAPFMKANRDPAADALPPELRYTSREPPLPTSRWWKADVRFVGKSTEIAPGVALVTTESPYQGYYDRYPPHEREPDLDPLAEISLVLRSAKGDVLVVGCSHSGVERIVRATKDFTKRDVGMVMGGFHLLPYDEARIRELANELEKLGVRRVAPAHCTGHVGFKVFREVYGDRCAFAGLGADVAF